MKRYLIAAVLLVLPAAVARAQQTQNFVINVGTPEGQLLQSIGQEADEAKKVAMMEEFLEKYPKHEGAGWVCVQLQQVYLGKKDFAKALASGQKTLANNPDAVDVGFNTIKAAEGKDDDEAVKEAALKTAAAVRKATSSGKPPSDEEEKQRLEHIKDVGNYAEYALYAQILKSKDAKSTVALGEALEQANPKSQYLWLATPNYLAAQGGKACASADKLVAADSKNAEAMLVAADCSWRAQRADRVIAMGNRAIEALNSRPKVDGGNEGAKIGRANFYVGTGYSMQGKFGPANKALRAALPALKGDSQLTANALFNLGFANYSLGKAIGDRKQIRDGLTFFEQCAEISSSVQDQAARNVRQIRTELGLPAK